LMFRPRTPRAMTAAEAEVAPEAEVGATVGEVAAPVAKAAAVAEAQAEAAAAVIVAVAVSAQAQAQAQAVAAGGVPKAGAPVVLKAVHVPMIAVAKPKPVAARPRHAAGRPRVRLKPVAGRRKHVAGLPRVRRIVADLTTRRAHPPARRSRRA
jgi:hypothetical protein